MKIRHSFVSNSSSTSYIIAITREFTFTPDEINLFRIEYEEYRGYKCDNSDEEIQQIVSDIVDELCRTGKIREEENSDIYPFCYSLDDSYIVADISVGPEDGGVINILNDKEKSNVLATMKAVVQRHEALAEMEKCKEDKNESS